MKTLLNLFSTSFKNISIERAHSSLLAIVLFAAVMAKGAVVFRGYATDDYVFSLVYGPGNLDIIIANGRYLAAGILWAINSLGVDASNTYFAFGILAIILQVTFVTSMLRFIGADKISTSGLIGALVVTHPYFAEILTFRISLPFYCVAMVFSIICLEMLAKDPTDWRMRLIAFCAVLAMLFTYQSFLNYFAVIAVFSLILGQLASAQAIDSRFEINYQHRAFALIGVSATAVISYIGITKVFVFFRLSSSASRSTFIDLDMIPSRLVEVNSSLLSIYWVTQPVIPGWIKVCILALVFGSIVSILLSIRDNKRVGGYGYSVFVVLLLLALLIPISIGIILPLRDWWPVPRIVAHIAVIIGFIFVLSDLCCANPTKGALRLIGLSLRVLIVLAFILINNQIFADQLKINSWDRSFANRIVARLEETSGFPNIKYLHIVGGHWGYPAGLRTVIGDQNISALLPSYSKLPLISSATGYKFEQPNALQFEIGERYCKGRTPWPHADSIAVIDDLGIVCLKNE